jgi:hypothetical protein
VQLMRRHLAAGELAAAIRQYELPRAHSRTSAVRNNRRLRPARPGGTPITLLRDAVGSPTRLGALLAEFAALLNGQNAAVADLSAASTAALPTLVPMRSVGVTKSDGSGATFGWLRTVSDCK